MCGIAGLWRFGGDAESRLRIDARAMTDAIAYRGPDGDGQWIDAEAGVALGHRRLAIVDLTPTGAQPMASADGRVIITYNGELYNAAEMAAELAMPFRGTSDTEVLVEAIARFGIDGALRRANGLFAFAAFDRSSRSLHLARDRMGIKPLYWTRQGDTFAFASELKALRTLRDLKFALDLNAVASYLRHACVPAPLAIFRDVHKLKPAHRIEVSKAGAREVCYWDLPSVAMTGQAVADRRDDREIADQLHHLLRDAVKRQMVSDVPLGAFLSGGVDSSAVVALMAEASNSRVKTFSIGFREQAFNEADDARRIANHIGTDHTELILSAADAQQIIPLLPEIYDEPFADSSQLPTYIVSRLARQHVTVALSGDGGDENFGGYVRYQGIDRLWKALRRVPMTARRLASSAIGLASVDTWDALARPFPRRLKPAHLGDKIIKASRLFSADGPSEMYQRLITQWPETHPILIDSNAAIANGVSSCRSLDTVGNLRLLDMRGYLPDDILTKVDRASMAVSLEVRVPLLDHRVVEFAWGLPSRVLIRDGIGKRPLRAVLDRYVPRKLIERPKMGFGVPIGQWISGPLRDWSEDLLSHDALAKDGIFDASVVRQRFDEHLSGRRNWQYALWTVLQFQAWRRVYG
jgi:asparagine synthase (glutamine-hydrolysing)